MLAVWLSKSKDFTDTNTEQLCNDAYQKDTMNYKEGGECHLWDNSQCRRGTFKNRTCASSGRLGPILLLVLGVVFLGFSIYYGVLYIRS